MSQKRVRPTKNDMREKTLRCLELRRAGMTYDQIAERIGYKSAAAVYTLVKDALDKSMQEPIEDVRRLEIDRLDRLELAVWPKAMNGDLGAADRILKIAERRARLLGLDAPSKQEVEVTAYKGGTDIDREVERLAATIKGTAGGSPVPVEGTASTTGTDTTVG